MYHLTFIRTDSLGSGFPNCILRSDRTQRMFPRIMFLKNGAGVTSADVVLKVGGVSFNILFVFTM